LDRAAPIVPLRGAGAIRHDHADTLREGTDHGAWHARLSSATLAAILTA
jgi:hypothetical protein